MLATCYGGDKLFDDGIRFPRGDAGPQMFGRGTTKFSGDEWNKSQRPRQAIEVGSNQKDVVRSWKAPGCEHIIYQVATNQPRSASAKQLMG